MSEYWKSTPKYWCKHCSAYVKDTPFERKQHESTAKHQGNLKRFLRGIQNDHERSEREKEKVKAEVDRLNRVVGGSSGDDQAALPGPSKPPSIRKTVPTALTAADQKKQWAQLAEMGIQVPDSAGAEFAVPGQWQRVAERPVDQPDHTESLSTGVRKRKHFDDDEEEEGSDIKQTTVRRGWGSTTKRYPGADLDLDALLNSAMIKETNSRDLKGDQALIPTDTDKIQAKEMKVEVDVVQPEDESDMKRAGLGKQEATDDNGSSLPTALPDLEDIPVFKKRKAKARGK